MADISSAKILTKRGSARMILGHVTANRPPTAPNAHATTHTTSRKTIFLNVPTKMYRHLLKKVQSPPVAFSLLKRHASWTQGEGPNYSKNLIVLGIATAAGVMFAFGYQRWKFSKEFDVNSE